MEAAEEHKEGKKRAHRHYDNAIYEAAATRVANGERAAAVARDLGLPETTVHSIVARAERGGSAVPSDYKGSTVSVMTEEVKAAVRDLVTHHCDLTIPQVCLMSARRHRTLPFSAP